MSILTMAMLMVHPCTRHFQTDPFLCINTTVSVGVYGLLEDSRNVGFVLFCSIGRGSPQLEVVLHPRLHITTVDISHKP